MIIHFITISRWEKESWTGAWAVLGEIREFCEDYFGKEGITWRIERRPHQALSTFIEFDCEEDALFFTLTFK